ncbi:MAG: imidazole glycerol phosphate synthase subunit HisH [Proteobacteria bacterium]|nr:imidazole glycerol phosphate synthase subunit HisH [Pseudomonadota bacterium]
MSQFIIIDYSVSNLSSVKNAMVYLNCDVKISNAIKDIEQASALILPGVGAFGEGMSNLRNLELIDVLNKAVLKDKKPILGICLGFQLFARSSSEMGLNKGLGWIDADVTELKVTNDLRLPHIGWNTISVVDDSPLLKDIPDPNFYFVHSFAMHDRPENTKVSTCRYGSDFIATIHKENILGTQFHPEKSHASGLTVLRNFIRFVEEYHA